MNKTKNVGMYRKIRLWMKVLYRNNNTIDDEGGLHLGEADGTHII